MKQKEKQTYVAPAIEVIEMETESVLATSGTNPGNGGGVDLSNFNRSGSRSRGGAYATGSEIEDMLNDILTIEN